MGANTVTPEDAVRAYFPAYSEGHPGQFDELVSANYVDYGHTPPGRGPQGARDDDEHAVQITGGLIRYDIGALVARDDTVALGSPDRPRRVGAPSRPKLRPSATPSERVHSGTPDLVCCLLCLS
jgi:hypothetical protein